MARFLKPGAVVISSATRAAGPATAALLLKRGARLLLVDSDEARLSDLARRLGANGRVAWMAAEVSERAQVAAAAQRAQARFGRISAWVHLAPGGLVRPLLEGSLEEERAHFEAHFWGTVNACEVALSHLRERGGSLVVQEDVMSERAFPLRGAHAAAAHAVKAWVDALRMEWRKAHLPVRVTLVKAGWVESPFPGTAPLYAPEVVARALVSCVRRPRRDLVVGLLPKLVVLGEKALPGLTDRLTIRWMERRRHRTFTFRRSLYTWLTLHRRWLGAALAVAMFPAAASALRRGSA